MFFAVEVFHCSFVGAVEGTLTYTSEAITCASRFLAVKNQGLLSINDVYDMTSVIE